MRLVGSGGQQRRDLMYDSSGLITIAGPNPTLVLPEAKSRSMLFLQNISADGMFVEFGSCRGHAVLTSGVVTSVVMDNVGFNFTRPPSVRFMGGGNHVEFNPTHINTAFVGATADPTYASPQDCATGTAVLSGATVGSVTIVNGGSGYVTPPFVFFENSLLDPNGAADPSLNSGMGWYLPPGGAITFIDGTFCPTDSISIFGQAASGTQRYSCKWTS